jgi:hypothetical protein
MRGVRIVFRNLSCRVRILEFKSKVTTRFPQKRDDSEVLCGVYNNQQGGPLFCTGVLTTVWHHDFSPNSTDEIKIRLPPILTDRHWLEFEVRHVHIKLKSANGMTSWLYAKKEGGEDNKPESIGVGYLQLLPLGLTMLHEGRHIVHVRRATDVAGPDDLIAAVHSSSAIKKRNEEADSRLPHIVVATRCMTSFKSTDPIVQKALSWGPIPLGYLPSSVLHFKQRELTVPFGPSELRAANVIRDLQSTNITTEATNHFLVLMRHLVRAMCGGNGLYNEVYTSPYEHATVRCQAFLTLLQLFGRLVPDVKIRREGCSHTDMDVLTAYIEYLFDDEVPERGQSSKYSSAAILHAISSMTGESNFLGGGNHHSIGAMGDEIGPDRGEASEDVDYEEGNDAPRVRDFEPDSVDTYEDGRARRVTISDAATIASSVMRSSSFAEDPYIEYVATHCALQASRIVLEDLIESCVADIIGLQDTNPVDADLLGILGISEHEANGLRWWSEEIYNVGDIKRSGSQRSPLVRGNKSPGCFSRVPFQPEASWFRDATDDIFDESNGSDTGPPPPTHASSSYKSFVSSLTSGMSFDSQDQDDDGNVELMRYNIKHSVLDGFSSRRDKIFLAAAAKSQELDVTTGQVEGLDPTRLNRIASMMRPNSASTPVSPNSSIGSHTPNDVRSRKDSTASSVNYTNGSKTDLDAKIAISLSCTPTHIQWWPWTYEVITYQWLSLLCVLQKSQPPELPVTMLVSPSREGYPITVDKIPKDPRPWFDTRHLALDHGPTLLRMIVKSLALRIHRERKRGLIVLDADYMIVLLRLLETISYEALLDTSDLFGSRNLVAAMSQFCMTLFGIVVPGQVAQLVQTVMRALRTQNHIKQVELRLLFVEYFSYFDQFVSVNCILPLDCSYSLLKHGEYLRHMSIDRINRYSSKTSLRIQDILVDPHPHWLAELIMVECMDAYRLKDQSVTRDASLRILLDLLIRQSFDGRYQGSKSRQRVVMMYVPLLGEIMKETEILVKSAHNSPERRGLLTLLLYMLQDLPNNLLSEIFRIFCDNSFTTTAEDDYGVITVETSFNGSTSPLFRSGGVDPNDSNPNITVSTESHSPAAHAGSKSHLTLWQILNLLHLLLDTFEISRPDSGVSPSASLYSPADLMSPHGLTTASMPAIRSDPGPLHALSNSTIASGGISEPIGQPGHHSVSHVTQANTNANALVGKRDLLERAQMDRIHKLRGGGSSKRLDPDAEPDEDRMKHYRDKRASRGKTNSIDLSGEVTTARHISIASSMIVASTLRLIIQECPHRLLYGIRSDGDRRINNSAMIAASAGQLDPEDMSRLLESCLAVILHALHTLQSESVLVEMFAVAGICINRFGARLFITVVGDSLQDWARCCLRYCAAKSSKVTQAASKFMVTLFRACFYYFGSLHVAGDVYLSVFDDVLEELLKPLQEMKRTYDDEDDVLLPMALSFATMQQYFKKKSDDARKNPRSYGSNNGCNNMIPFYSAALKLLTGFQLLILADAQRRRHVSHQVGYDWSGVNMLDGPFDNLSVSAHQVHILRMNRALLKENPDTKRQKLETEEVMELFYKASEVFDPVRLPRQHIRWLESLARLADLKTYRAEAGIARWRIFKICLAVKDTWQSAWAPRQPLQWIRGRIGNCCWRDVFIAHSGFL